MAALAPGLVPVGSRSAGAGRRFSEGGSRAPLEPGLAGRGIPVARAPSFQAVGSGPGEQAGLPVTPWPGRFTRSRLDDRLTPPRLRHGGVLDLGG